MSKELKRPTDSVAASGEPHVRPWDARLAARLVAPLRGTRVRPNHLTTLRMLFALAAFSGFAAGGAFWANVGAVCFAISNFVDHTDGELARMTGMTSRFGHYYDLVTDALSNILLFVGMGIGLSHGGYGNWAIPAGCAAGIAVAAIFQMRHEIEKAIGKTDNRQPHFGYVEAEDILYLLPLVTFCGALYPFLLLSAIGAPLFAFWVLREYLAVRDTARP